jgi:hypothetical protein
MAKKQTELPHTRRDDEPAPKSIDELDEACSELEKAKGKAVKAGQGVAASKQIVDGLLRKHGLRSYPYETATGVEKRARINESIKTEKIKKDRGDGDGADE